MNRENRFGTKYLSFDDFFSTLSAAGEKGEPAALVALDYDNFNYVNDLFGYDAGDRILAALTRRFDRFLCEGEAFCRLTADHFNLFLLEKYGDYRKRVSEIANAKQVLEENLTGAYTMVASAGVVPIENGTNTASLSDRANYARKKAKGGGTDVVILFDETLRDELEWRKIVAISAENALRNGEFVMYLQPKIQMRNGRVDGAEALVRWIDPERGLILPDRFIPIFEQNGFVLKIDYLILDEACRFLGECRREGLPLLPISVNFSKFHLNDPDFVEKVAAIARTHGVDPRYIEIEMTENVFSEDFQRLIGISTELKKRGFRLSLDDFGKAYSSLNYLKELPLDIIKIDKGFLNATKDSEKGRVIIAKIVELIKSLRMVSVMEGVETEQQVEFLENLGCDLAQGFYYAKPMPKEEYRALLKRLGSEAPGDFGRSIFRKEEDASEPEDRDPGNRELYALGKNIDMGIVKNKLDETSTLLYVNGRTLEYFGYTRKELRELFCDDLGKIVVEEDRPAVTKRMIKLATDGGSVEYHARIRNKSGAIRVLEGRSTAVADEKGAPVAIHAFRDITDEIERAENYRSSIEEKIRELELSNERYRTIAELSEDIVFEWDFERDFLTFSQKYERFFGEKAIAERFSVNPETRERIHPADHEAFERWVSRTFRKPGVVEAEFRVRNAEEKYVWVRVRSTASLDGDGMPIRAVGVFIDIDKQKNEVDYLTLKSQLDPLTRLLNKEEIRRRIEDFTLLKPDALAAFAIVDIDNFKGVNDNLGHQFGDGVLKEISQKITALTDENDLVGRLGGDEILIFMREIKNKRAAAEKIGKILTSVRGTYFGAAAKYDISASAGLALFPLDSANYDELYRLADVALYESKRLGKDCFTFYNTKLAESAGLRTPMEWSERFLAHYFEGDLIYNVFEQLYETKETDTTIGILLEMLGKKYNVDRAYIFEFSPDGKYTENTYEWCAEGITPEKDNLQSLSTEDLRPFLESFGKDGILCRNDIAEMDPFSYRMLNEQGIKSMLHCATSDGGKMSGFIGFDMCREYRVWKGEEIAILGYISRVLSVFLLKRRAIRELEEATRNYAEVLDNLGEIVYVVDAETFELRYINAAAKRLGFRLGHPCFEEIFHGKEQCGNCPIRKLSPETNHAETRFFAEKPGIEMVARVSKLRWAGDREVILVICAPKY